MSNTAVRGLTAMAFVASVPQSIEFYRKLGFEVANTVGEPPNWAWLSSGKADLMIAKASHPVVAGEQAIMFYVYCDDVAAKRTELQAYGIECGEITTPFYSPRGEFRIKDPDGYDIQVSHT